MDDATGQLARFALELDARSLPAEVAAQARLILADTVGVILGASRRSAVRTAVAAHSGLAEGPCTVVGHGTAAPEVAAFVNGIGAHDIELDDFHARSRTHPAAVIVPAVLAGTELRPDQEIGTLLTAIVAGYDVEVRLAYSIGVGAQFDRGFHPSSVCGAVGAAVAAGLVLGLSLDELRSAIGLAASQASGLLTVADDHSHMAKSFQTGVAARNGVTAARFARSGYRAAPDVLTGRHSMLKPFGGSAADPSRLDEALGERFEIMATSLKQHACCALTHPALDALLELIQASGVPAADIAAIEVELAQEAVPRVDANRLWTHNTQYLMALAAHEGSVELDHFRPEWTSRPDIAALASRVTLRGNVQLQDGFPERQAAIVTITTPDGRRSREIAGPRGSPDRPLTSTEVAQKFAALAGPSIGDAEALTLWTELAEMPFERPLAPVLEGLSVADSASPPPA
jgi:2-methylcitrate dehydratase PrpD